MSNFSFIKMVDLFDEWIKNNHPKGRVLVFVNIDSPSRDLVDEVGVIIDPTGDDIDQYGDYDQFESRYYIDGMRQVI